VVARESSSIHSAARRYLLRLEFEARDTIADYLHSLCFAEYPANKLIKELFMTGKEIHVAEMRLHLGSNIRLHFDTIVLIML